MKRTDSEKKSNLVWHLFSSVKLTLILLIILATISIIGTVLPQQEEAVQFARKLSPRLFQLFSSLQLFDMYHSPWFRIIIGLLTLNLIICSIDRLPGTLKLFRAIPKPDRLKPFENLPPNRSFLVKGEAETIAARVAEILKGRFKKVQRGKTDKGHFIYGEKGRYSYFGVYLVHFSVLIILIGAIIGSLFGFEAYVNIAEGETVDTVALRKKMTPKKLGFSVHCKKFTVEFYDNGAPKEYRSDIEFLIEGKVVKKGSLLVNHPITYNGITFYQSSYGTIPGDKVYLKISKEGSDSEVSIMEVKKKDPITLPGNEGQFQVIEVDGNLKGMMGPAALISVQPYQGEEARFWIFQDIEKLKKRFPPAMLISPFLNPSAFKPYTFSLDGIEIKYYTGLQVNRDPGVPFVWTGCFLMVVGFFITFFTSHRRVWVRVSTHKKLLGISVAGRANKNPVGLEREMDQVIHKLQKRLKGQIR